jgi:SynChlorMet cassette protein ScmD
VGDSKVKDDTKAIANPLVVLREEFDDWAVLFDPDTGHAFGLNPTGVSIWKCLDGHHSIQDIMKALKQDYKGASDEIEEHLKGFIQDLCQHGLVGYEIQQP